MHRKNHLPHSLHLIAQIRTDTASRRQRGKLDENRLMCDEELVAHGLVETQGDSEVDAPTPRLSTAPTDYQRRSCSAIFERSTLIGTGWTTFREQGWVISGERPSHKTALRTKYDGKALWDRPTT